MPPTTRIALGRHRQPPLTRLLALLLALTPLPGAAATAAAQAGASRLWNERAIGAPPLTALPDFRALAQQLVPTVASIQVEQRVKRRGGPAGRLAPQDPFEYFRRYFGDEVPQEFHNRSLGSGFVIEASGLVLTNFHVVEDADLIEVTLPQADGSERTVAAKILGTAPDYDVALLRTLTPLTHDRVAYLGDSDTIQIGDWVMAVGNPFGLSHSVSTGIISAKERRRIEPSGRRGIYNFLQTDASINPGNSGGPLVNMRGEVIGINTAINAAGSGIGFAIPINMVKEMLPALHQTGRYVRSWMGIKVQDMTVELAQSYGLASAAGALVAEVVPGGPAATAHLQDGDIVLQFDGHDIRTADDLPLYVSKAGVARQVSVTVWRDGRRLTVSLTLTEFPDDVMPSASRPGPESSALGMQVTDLTPALREQLDLEATARGAVIKDVAAGSPAARAGLRRGDLVTALGGQPMADAQALSAAIRGARPGTVLRLKVNRHGTGVFVALKKVEESRERPPGAAAQ